VFALRGRLGEERATRLANVQAHAGCVTCQQLELIGDRALRAKRERVKMTQGHCMLSGDESLQAVSTKAITDSSLHSRTCGYRRLGRESKDKRNLTTRTTTTILRVPLPIYYAHARHLGTSSE
jgi:hypothetical protein